MINKFVATTLAIMGVLVLFPIAGATPSEEAVCMENNGGSWSTRDGVPARPVPGDPYAYAVYLPAGTGADATYPYNTKGWVVQGICSSLAALLRCEQDIKHGSTSKCLPGQADFYVGIDAPYNDDLPVLIQDHSGTTTVRAADLILDYYPA